MDRKRRGNEDPDKQIKHPKHLRGREIGLWYARNSRKQSTSKDYRIKTRGTVIISSKRIHDIRSLLNNVVQVHSQSNNSNAFEDLPDSDFKHKYISSLTTNILDDVSACTNMKRIENVDNSLRNDFLTKCSSSLYRRMQDEREKLPAFRMQSAIVELIEKEQVVLISGETGCGKTTQVPQFILDDHLRNNHGSTCRIVCSQPRRISAISVAERVASERGEVLGRSVGYQIRMENRNARDRGSITFCTTGVVLKRMESNPMLSNVSHLILDEVHERDMMSDIILALLKLVITKCTNLKIILMSATMNAKHFASFFHTNSHIHIPGLTFDVEDFYLEDVLARTCFKYPPTNERRTYGSKSRRDAKRSSDFRTVILPSIQTLRREQTYPSYVIRELMKPESEEINLDLVLALLNNLCVHEAEGAILVFLTGYADISKLHTLMDRSGNFPRSQFLIIPLHSQMPSSKQSDVFNRPPSGVRKIVLATNIAETSITIADVVYVIDCGHIKMSDFNSEYDEDTLKAQWVSKANASQRRGRAGRVQAGKCFHLISRARFALLEEQQKPELLRMRLDGLVLMLKMLRVGDAKTFLQTCIDVPQEENIDKAICLLKRMNALDDAERLTPLGFHLASLPVAPQMGKLMLMGSIFGCVEPAINIASALDFKDAFLMPLGKESLCRERKLYLADNCKSDHLLFHKTMRQYEESMRKRDFCWRNYLSEQIMHQLQQMKSQFADILFRLNFTNSTEASAKQMNVNSENCSLIRAIICASLYPNVFVNKTAIANRQSYARFHTLGGKKVDLHPKSIVSRVGPFDSPFMVYYRKVRSTGDFIYDVSNVHCLPLIFFGDNFQYFHKDGVVHISINDDLLFASNEDTAEIIDELRNHLNRFLAWKACKPEPVQWADKKEVCILNAIIELITTEEDGFECSDSDETSD